MRHLNVTDRYGVSHDTIIYNAHDFPVREILRGIGTLRKKHNVYYDIPCAFDIESTSILEGEDKTAFSYQWQFCMGETVCMGRTWEEYMTLVNTLNQFTMGKLKFVVYVHFLAFEFQFLKDFLEITSMFARKKRAPMLVRTASIEYRCSYYLSNMSLSQMCKKSPSCTFWKKDGASYNYGKLRTPDTPLTDKELEYCYCDVRGLCQCIYDLLSDGDTLVTLPMTSTGYVRREFRDYILASSDSNNYMENMKLDLETYNLCKLAIRGGNTHCNVSYTDQIISNVQSYDIKSSYPACMLLDRFPVTGFMKVTCNTREKLERWTASKACLFTFSCSKIKLKSLSNIPYIDKGHCRELVRGRYDNGRVLSADRLTMTVTDVDWHIIQSMYNMSGLIVTDMRIAEYGMLPKAFREKLLYYFSEKCKLENTKALMEKANETDSEKYKDICLAYAKYKNRINASYGMMVTDICSPDVTYDNGSWEEHEKDPQSMLNAYYRNSNSFLAYQHGVWVTANARKRLQDMLDVVGRDVVYLDTDSIKCTGNHTEDFAKMNEKLKEDILSNELEIAVTISNTTYYIGLWESEGTYDRLKSLGAKKYCTEKNGVCTVTVAGLSKEKGSAYLNTHNGLDDFAVGLIFHDSGRTTHHYNDLSVHRITVDGCTFTTASNIAVFDTTYQLGVTGEYAQLISDDEYLKSFELSVDTILE